MTRLYPSLAGPDEWDTAVMNQSKPRSGAPELARARAVLRAGPMPRLAVLVEGASDQVALETLADRRGVALDEEGVLILAMGGATSIGHFLELLGPHGYGLALAGLCDLNQEADFRMELERAGLGTDLTRPAMEALGFFVCEGDLEEELIRALTADGVKRIIDEQGELGSLNILLRQPHHRGRPVEQVLWRFMGSRSGRKAKYARLMVEALDLDLVPRPLHGVLDHIVSRGASSRPA
jgi:hypothetical protein